jgi:hypothetical protein
MPAGKAAVTGGVSWAMRLHFGVSIRSLRRYAKPRVAILKREDAKKLRHSLRSAFQIYMIDCATPAPTGTQRRKELRKIRAAARRLAAHPNWRAADGLLKALDTPDLDARIVAYKVLTAKGYTPFQFKRTLRHWTITSSAESSDIAAANELAQPRHPGARARGRSVPGPRVGSSRRVFDPNLDGGDRANGGVGVGRRCRQCEKMPVCRMAQCNASATRSRAAAAWACRRYRSVGQALEKSGTRARQRDLSAKSATFNDGVAYAGSQSRSGRVPRGYRPAHAGTVARGRSRPCEGSGFKASRRNTRRRS